MLASAPGLALMKAARFTRVSPSIGPICHCVVGVVTVFLKTIGALPFKVTLVASSGLLVKVMLAVADEPPDAFDRLPVVDSKYNTSPAATSAPAFTHMWPTDITATL